MSQTIEIAKYKFKKEQERLKRHMLDKYGTIENEWIAFLIANGEYMFCPHCKHDNPPACGITLCHFCAGDLYITEPEDKDGEKCSSSK